MQTFLLLCSGIVTIFILARLNKSNKLFWTLVLSMLAGFMGGAIASNASTPKKPKFETFVQSSQGIQSYIQQAIVLNELESYDAPINSKTNNVVTFNLNLTDTHKKTVNEYQYQCEPFDTS